MLVTGIAVLAATRLPTYQRIVPLLVGLWLPVTMLAGKFIGGTAGFYIMNAYSVSAWFAMGLVIFVNRNKLRRSHHIVEDAPYINVAVKRVESAVYS